MASVLDTNLLPDLAPDDPRFRARSMELLRKRRRAGLVACPVALVEIAPIFDGDAKEIRDFLDPLSVSISE